MSITTSEITEEEMKEAIEYALSKARYRFHITPGMIAHIETAEREARKRARRRWLKRLFRIPTR